MAIRTAKEVYEHLRDNWTVSFEHFEGKKFTGIFQRHFHYVPGTRRPRPYVVAV